LATFGFAIITGMDDYSPQEIERARLMTGEEKMRESLQVFERTSRLMFDGLRDEFPTLSEDHILQKLYERLAVNRGL
jgi:hypothetical protein